MTSEEAVAIAERYLAAKGVSRGPLRLTHYFIGDEYDPTCRPPPHWSVYFWYDQPVADPPDDMAKTCLCVTVDDASGAAQLICWL
jgi:hypothetical protein